MDLPYPLHILENMSKLSESELRKYGIADYSPAYVLRKMNVPASSVYEMYINSAICDTITSRVNWNMNDPVFWRNRKREIKLPQLTKKTNEHLHATTISRPIFDNDQNYAIIAVSNDSFLPILNTGNYNVVGDGATYVYQKAGDSWIMLGKYDEFTTF